MHMKIHEIADGSLILAPSHSHIELTLQCLKLNKKAIRFMTLAQYCDRFSAVHLNELELLYQIHDQMKAIQSQLNLFKNQACTFAFEKECLNFINQLHIYEIDVKLLPDLTPTQKELKLILSNLYTLPNNYKNIVECLNKITDANHLILAYPHASYAEKCLLNRLIHRGACLLDVEVKPSYEYYHTGNIRQEAEAAAQMIIQNQIPSSQARIACCDSKGLSFVQQVFERYNIKISPLTQNYPAKCTQQALALLKFSLDDTQENLIECLQAHCFKDTSSFLQAQKLYPINWKEDYPNFTLESMQTDLWNQHELNQLLSCIEQAREQKQACFEKLEKLTSEMSVKQRFTLIDEYLRDCLDPAETSIMAKIQQLFITAHSYIHTKKDYALLLDAIAQLKSSASKDIIEPMLVSGLKELTLSYNTLFILNSSQNTFPGFSPLSGVFDENYVALISGFPTLDQRYQYHLNQMLLTLRQAHKVIIFRPLNEFNGKSIESSLDIDDYLRFQSQSFKLVEADNYTHAFDNLTPLQAKQLYTHNNILNGSVSALEKYIGCPYAYFLRYGLKLYEPMELGFNVAKIGSLNHAILEKLVQEKGKEYTKTNQQELEVLIRPYLQDMHVLFPQIPFELMQKRLLSNMMWNLKQLDEIESHSSNLPSEVEMRFEHLYNFKPVGLYLTGIIDRVDHNETTFTILDYKSSTKKLDPAKVFSGQQLQLCTYLTHLAENQNKRPLGAFYYALNNTSLSLPFEKVDRRKKDVIQTDEEALKKAMINSNRLQGWFFEDSKEYLDDNNQHVSTLSKNRILDIDEMRNKIEAMLEIISNQILAGRIDIEPNEAACTFCKYRSICRFIGNYTEKKLLVELPACFQKGEAEHEEME